MGFGLGGGEEGREKGEGGRGKREEGQETHK